jgi:hypothetical protein
MVAIDGETIFSALVGESRGACDVGAPRVGRGLIGLLRLSAP